MYVEWANLEIFFELIIYNTAILKCLLPFVDVIRACSEHNFHADAWINEIQYLNTVLLFQQV